MDDRNIIWIDGFLYEYQNAKIHILTHSLHYGTAVFEGIRCYKTQKGLAIFRLKDHLKRLFDSAKIYFMNIEYSMKELEDAIIKTIKKNGFDEAILLNTSGKVVKASAKNIFIVKNKTLITPPISSGSLEGITRDTVLALAKEDSILTEIRDISKDELYLADEIFLTGTAAEIKSVGEIDNRMIGNGKTGTITKRIKKLFEKAIRGNHKYSEKWLVYISNN